MTSNEELKPLEPNSNRPLPSRPPLERCKNVQTSVWTECTVDNGNIICDTNSYWKQNENSSDFLLRTNQTLQLIMDSTSLFINAYLINNTASLSTPSFSSTKQPYINLPTFIYIQVALIIPILTAIHSSLHMYILYWFYLIKLQMTLFIFSFKPRYLHQPII